MTIRVVQQLRHDRFEVILDGVVREYLDPKELAQHASLGETIVWDIKKPVAFESHRS